MNSKPMTAEERAERAMRSTRITRENVEKEIRAAILQEREENAKIAEAPDGPDPDGDIAAVIRARPAP